MNKDRSQSLKVALHLQEMENNPCTVEDIKLLEMFEKEGFSNEEAITYLDGLFKEDTAIAAE